MTRSPAADVRRALDALQAEERAREARIAALISAAQTSIAGSEAAAADDVAPRLARVAQRSADLEARMQGTAGTASHLYGEMQQLHEERQRVELSMKWCRAVVQLKQACAALAKALEHHDWDAGAAHCAAALEVDEEILHSEFARHSVPSTMLPDPAPQTLARLRTELLEALTKNFAHYTAPATQDEAQATRFLSLFPVVHAHAEGLAAYTAFAVALVHAQGKGVQEKLLATPPNAPYYGMLWGAVFDALAIFIHEHEPVVDRLFLRDGHAGFVQGVLPGLSQEWTRLGMQILEVWDEKRQRVRMLRDANAYRFTVLDGIRGAPHTPGRIFGEGEKPKTDLSLPFSLTRPSTPSAAPPEVPTPDIAHADVLLTELAAVSSQWALFRQFLRNQLKTDVAVVDAAAGRAPDASLSARLDALVSETFFPLQIWSLRASIERVHALDTPDLSARPITSSLPDDLFFMLRTIFTRTLSASSLELAERVVTQALALLETEFVEIVVLRMDGCRRALNVPRLVDGPRRAAAVREVKATMIVYLNVLDVSAAYTERILADLHQESFLMQYFDASLPDRADPDVSATSELSLAQDIVSRIGSLTPKLRSALQFETEELYTTLVEPRVQALLHEMLHDLSYDLDEAAYARAEDADAVAARLRAGWESVLPGYREQLTEPNYALLFGHVLDAILAPWEGAVMHMRFSELGALRFDKDLRSMLAFFAAQTPWGVRDKFAKLQQVAYVLNRDDDDEGDIYEAGASLGISWQLSPSEVQQVRALRS